MNFYKIDSYDDIQPGYFNIPEPKSNIKLRTPDIIIVPGVAFSYEFERLGYGGGFYDTYLCDKDILKIAICFEFQMMDKLPVEEHDIKMDMIVTENNIYKKINTSH